MRQIILAALLLTNFFAHAQFCSTGMISRLTNPNGTPVKDANGRESTFQMIQFGIVCNDRTLEVRTSASAGYQFENSSLVKNKFESATICEKAKSTILATISDFKVLLVVADKGDHAGQVVDVNFCAMQANDVDCWNSKFTLDARKY